MPSIMRPLSPAETTARVQRAEVRVVRAAQRQGWLAVGGGLASVATVALVAPRCERDAACELVRHAEVLPDVPRGWRSKFAAAGVVFLPSPTDGYVCVIGTVSTR